MLDLLQRILSACITYSRRRSSLMKKNSPSTSRILRRRYVPRYRRDICRREISPRSHAEITLRDSPTQVGAHNLPRPKTPNPPATSYSDLRRPYFFQVGTYGAVGAFTVVTKDEMRGRSETEVGMCMVRRDITEISPRSRRDRTPRSSRSSRRKNSLARRTYLSELLSVGALRIDRCGEESVRCAAGA